MVAALFELLACQRLAGATGEPETLAHLDVDRRLKLAGAEQLRPLLRSVFGRVAPVVLRAHGGSRVTLCAYATSLPLLVVVVVFTWVCCFIARFGIAFELDRDGPLTSELDLPLARAGCQARFVVVASSSAETRRV